MTRPTDWSALGLDSDPTPGDPDQVQDVYNLINTLSGDYQTILDTIDKVNGYAASDNLTGAAAAALKDQMNGRITKFVQSAQEAFSQAAPALKTYHDALNTHQSSADNLLTQAQNSGLKSDDAKVKGWAGQAKQAGTDLQTASDTATTAIQHLPGPSNPLSPWQEFLQILGWIALLLILPAMVFGGVFALAAILVNAVLFVNALVEFAKGQMSLGGLLLAALGMIAPTTRALNFGELVNMVKGMGSFIKSGFVNVRAGLSTFMDMLNTTKLTDLISLETLMKLGNFALKGGVWVFTGLKELPTTMITAATAFSVKFGELFVAGGLKVFTSIKTGSFLSLVLPVDAVEVEKLGLLTALRLGFVDRGLGITADPATNLANLNKLALAGVGKGGYHFNGFGYLDTPRPTIVDIDVKTGLNADLAKIDTNFSLTALDLHLGAPTLSINNLAAGFEHGSLDIGTVSLHVPSSNFGLSKLEIPDLRYPKELNDIGNGTVIAKLNDVSFVAVREDKVPLNVDANISDLSAPTLHTGELSVPTMHTGEVNIAALHTGDVTVSSLHTADLSLPTLHQVGVPNLTTNSVHVAESLNTTVTGLHLSALNSPDLHAVNLANVSATRLPTAHDMPNIATTIGTKIDAAEMHGLAITQTDASLKITGMPNMTDISLTGAVSHTDALAHVATPSLDANALQATHVDLMAGVGNVTASAATHLHPTTLTGDAAHLNVSTDIGALQHLATNNPLADVHTDVSLPSPNLTTPHLSASHLGTEAHVDTVPTEIRALQTNPEISIHTNDMGMHVDLNAAQVNLAAHTETNLAQAEVSLTGFGTFETALRAARTSLNPRTGDAVALPAAAVPKFRPGQALSVQTPNVASHTDADVPAVSSSGADTIDNAAAHSAGARGEHFAEPDLAGVPGLIDPNGEKLAVAWTGFKQAQHDFVQAKTEHDLQFGGADPKSNVGMADIKGKGNQTDAQAAAVANLDTAAKSLNAAGAELHGLDADPLRLTLQAQRDLTMSLNARPRLVGGSRPGDEPLDVDPVSGQIMTAGRSLGPNHRLFISFNGDREEFGEVVNVHTEQVEFGGRHTEMDTHGSFRIDSLGGGEGGFREFQSDGTVHAEGIVLTDHAGNTLGEIAHHPDGTTDLRAFDGSNPAPVRFQELGDHGFRITDSNGLSSVFNWSGTAFRPKQLFDHSGTPTFTVEIDHAAGTAHSFHNDGTVADTWSYSENADGGFRMDLLGGDRSFTEFHANGTVRAEGVGLVDHLGNDLGEIAHFPNGTTEFRPHGEATGTIVHFDDLGGNGFSITDSNGVRRFFAWDGTLHESKPLFNLDGTAGVTIVIDRGNNLAHSFQNDGTIAESWRYSEDGSGFRIDSLAAGGGFREFRPDGTVHTEGIGLADHLGNDLGEIAHFPNGTTELRPHGAAGASNVRFESLGADGFRITESDGSHFTFDWNGTLLESKQLFDHRGNPTVVIEIDHAAQHAFTFHDGGDAERWTFQPEPNGSGDFRLQSTAADDTSWLKFNDNGRLIGRGSTLVHADGHGIGDLELSLQGAPRARTATITTADGTRIVHTDVHVNENETLFTAADGSAFQVADRGGVTVLTHAELHVTLRGDAGDLNTAHVDYENGTAGFHAPGLPDQQWQFTHYADHESFTLTSQNGEHVLTFNENDELTQHVITTQDANYNALTPIIVLHDDNRAIFTHPNHPGHTQWTFTPDADELGGFKLTSLDDVHSLRFNAQNELRFSDFNTRNPVDGEMTGIHVRIDHGATPNAISVVDRDGTPVADFRASLTNQGHVVLTDVHNGYAHGSFTEFDAATGAVRNERVHLHESSGMQIDVDHLAAGGPRPSVHNAAPGSITAVTRDATNGRLQIQGMSAGRPNDLKIFDSKGIKAGEHISITDAKGRPLANNERFEVTGLDGDEPKWTRADTNGQVGPLMQRPPGANANEGRLSFGFGTQGAATVKKDGTLVLEGDDKTPVYTREQLFNGQSLELTRLTDGSRRWTTWDRDGVFTGSGIRHFSNEENGAVSYDLDTFGRTLRHYRVGLDGGVIRAERQGFNDFHWARFTKDGEETLLSGTRTRPLGGLLDDALGWKDTFTRADGTSIVAQRNWSAYNAISSDWHFRPFTHASHYREYAIKADANTGAYAFEDSYKEVSQQGKDAGSLELLANGHKLEFTRYSEQRVPDFLWKTPDNISNGFSKLLAKSYLGSKWGALDFPKDGFVTGDARFQVFKWVERDGGGAVRFRGVRVLNPDGWHSDFTHDGMFVRGTVKLDNGNIVEIGRDPADTAKWASFRTNADGTRATQIHWQELDGDKNVVSAGTREFQGSQWRDIVRGDDHLDHVVRQSTPTGDVIHFSGTNKPLAHAVFPQLTHDAASGTTTAITRNTIGQIVGRTDGWGKLDGGTRVDITGDGDPRTGNWTWRGDHGMQGVRVTGRNTPFSGSWDDSFADFRTMTNGQYVQIRDLRVLDKGTSLRGELLPNGTWRSAKFDFNGDPIDGTQGMRQWRYPTGHTYHPQPGIFDKPTLANWRDLDADGNVLREFVDGKVREYTDPANGTHTWKEYNFGSAWRERQTYEGHQNLYIEKETFAKQWRVTDQAGNLVRFRSVRGVVMERDTLGRWTMVGTERETKGYFPWTTKFRAWNKESREPNRQMYLQTDGVVGEFKGKWARIGERAAWDFLQDFVIDVAANIIITGATDGWDFSGTQIGTWFVGAGIRGGFKAGYTVLTETAMKNFRDGLRNLDGGKDWNRQPFSNADHWDSEWAGNENPMRWRIGTFDFFVGNTFVPAIGGFVATLVTGGAFGFGAEGTKLDAGQLFQAAGLSMAGGLVGGLTFGAIKTLGHLGLGGRWFHSAGASDIAITFGEKLAIDYLVNDILVSATGLSASPVVHSAQAQQEAANGGS